MRRKILTGKQYGRLTVIGEAKSGKQGQARWKCLCECGKEKDVAGYALENGLVISCGCHKRELFTKHNMSRTKIYKVWESMKQRCGNEKDRAYHNYGGRGIAVCPEWRDDFQSFYEWAMANGYEDGLQIDRINNDGDYEPGNCQWITSEENTRKRFE